MDDNERIIARRRDESFAAFGERLYKLAGYTRPDINTIVAGGTWNGAHGVASKLYNAGYLAVDTDHAPLSITSLIHIWLQS